MTDHRAAGGAPPPPTHHASTVGPTGNHSPSPRLLSLRDAATLLGISVWTLRDLVASGKLRAVQPPGIRRIWIDRRDLDKAIENWKS